MGIDFLSRAARFLQERKEYRRWLTAFICLALVVAFGTVTALKMYGQAMTHQVKVLDCQYQVHEHTEDCYEENEDGEKVLICGLADYVIHVHNDDCYDEQHNLVCPLEEHEPHEHSEDCWEDQEVLVCEEEEFEGNTEEKAEDHPKAEEVKVTDPSTDAQNEESKEDSAVQDTLAEQVQACEKEEHTHTENCYAQGAGCEKEEHTHGDECYERELTCEVEEHIHEEGCYTTEGSLTCEAEEHEHGEGCYDEEGNLVCEKEEHTHDDSCYEKSEELTCTTGEHIHGDGCYTEKLVCEKEEHTHDDSCKATSELICEKEEHTHDDSCTKTVEGEKEEEPSDSTEETEEQQLTAEGEDTEKVNDDNEHTHGDDCYETKKVMICKEQEPHIHDDSCYDESCFDEEGNLIEGSRVSCGLLQLEEHVHTEECFKVVELTPEEIAALDSGAELHIHTENCYDEEGNLICNDGQEEKQIYYCGKEEHTHNKACYNENGEQICELEEHIHDESCLIEAEEPFYYCGKEEHTHGEGCYDENSELICELIEHTHNESCLIPGLKLVAETEDYFIVLEASSDAFPDVKGELVLEAVKLSENSPEHETASQMVEEKLKQDRIENKEAETNNSKGVNVFPFDISIKGDNGEEIPVQMPGEKEWEQRIFDIRVLEDGVEVQPVMPVRVSFAKKTEGNAAAISEDKPEKVTGEVSGPSLKIQEDNVIDRETVGKNIDSDEEVRIFHVDPEKELVEDMKAGKDEEGNAIINTPHFSEYAVLTVLTENGITQEVQIPAANTPWQRLALLFYEGKVNNCTVEISLQSDLVVENLDENNEPIPAKPIWIDTNRKLILDLNGHKIVSGRSSIDQKDPMAWFRVSNNNNGAGSLIIRDSASELNPYSEIDKVSENEKLAAVPDYNENTWNQDYHGEYDSEHLKAIYYLTESNRSITANDTQLPEVSTTTTENTYKHEISFEGIGAIENNGKDDLSTFIWVGDGGKVTIEGGRLTNLYGSAIMSPEGGTNKKITINGGYLVGNGQKKARQWGGAVFADGACDITIGEKAVIIVNKSSDEGGGIHLDSKGTKPSVLIKKGSIISSNETGGRGGGINVKGVNLTVEGGLITNNFAGSGGGLSVDGTFKIKDVVIAGNTVSGGGGGLHIGTSESGVIEGGVYASNRARAEGGGIHLDSGHVILEANAREGNLIYITNNKTISNTGVNRDWGGGGIFISEGNGQMTIYDSVVTGNTAKGFGGGVSGCSTGRLSIEETRGTAIYENEAVGGTPVGDIIDGLSGGGSSKHDDHDAYNSDVFNAKDENGNYKKDFQDIFSALSSIVGPKMLGGGAALWEGSCDYTFVKDNTQEIISTKLLGLTAHPEDASVDNARKTARIFISGNYSGTHGGGIMCNGLVILGQKENILYNESLTMDFTKGYQGIDGSSKQPTDGQFQFELLDQNGECLAVYSTTASPNTSGTNVLGVLGINFKEDGNFSPINSQEPEEITTGNGAIGHHTYYLREKSIPNDSNLKYDDTIYKIEFDVKCKGRKITLGTNYEITQYWLYIDDANAKVSVVDKIGEDSSEISDVTVTYEFSGIGDYNGNTSGHKGAHLSIREKTIASEGADPVTSVTFLNKDRVETLSFEILKTNGLQVEQGKDGYMSYVNFQLTGLKDGKKDKTIFQTNGKTDDSGKVEFSSVPNKRGEYLLEETVPDGFEKAGPWIVETDGKNNILIYVAEERKVTETLEGEENTDCTYEKGEALSVEKKNESGSIQFYINIVNTPILYSLPETGGPGLDAYTIAGALLILFGAGFLYKKKFSERRVQ